ncbi:MULTISPECIES: helix-turn-helix domain-containing protein [Haloferax]|uniref:helix-turn-helix domain-containing protein n=1 Tax=Haloferax TaxID=2251 RepID=UPI001CD9CAA3|nr:MULTISPECIES: helix-turn-helix domain-containing protein [Haloferax]
MENVHNQIDDGVCYAEVTVTNRDCDTGQVLHTTNRIEGSCLCLAFSNVECVPRIKRVDDGVMLIETYVSDRAVISELVEELKSVAERVNLRRLTRRKEGATESSPTSVDLSHLTAKQREAATMAVSRGYYQTPRQVSLEDLAASLDISKSALSQRLSAVESKLATAVFDP